MCIIIIICLYILHIVFNYIYIFCALRKMAKVHMSILSETLVSFFLLHDHFTFAVLLSHVYGLWILFVFCEWVCVLVHIFWGLGLVKGQWFSWSVAATLCFGKLKVPSNSGSLSSLSVTRYWSMWYNKTCPLGWSHSWELPGSGNTICVSLILTPIPGCGLPW